MMLLHSDALVVKLRKVAGSTPAKTHEALTEICPSQDVYQAYLLQYFFHLICNLYSVYQKYSLLKI